MYPWPMPLTCRCLLFLVQSTLSRICTVAVPAVDKASSTQAYTMDDPLTVVGDRIKQYTKGALAAKRHGEKAQALALMKTVLGLKRVKVRLQNGEIVM